MQEVNEIIYKITTHKHSLFKLIFFFMSYESSRVGPSENSSHSGFIQFGTLLNFVCSIAQTHSTLLSWKIYDQITV